MEPKNFSIKEALDFGWRKTKENLGFFIKLSLFSFAVSFIFGFLLFFIVRFLISSPISLIIIQIINNLWALFIYLGLIKIYLNFYDGIENKLSFLFSQKKAFLKFLLPAFLVGVIVGFLSVLGSVLFFLINNWVGKIFSLFLTIFLVLYFIVRFQFVPYFIVDKNSGPVESLKNSWNLTKGVVGKIFLLYLTLILINILGVLFFIVGLFITIPVSGLAMIFVYRKLLGQHELSSNALPNNQ